ncbi:MAG: putative membrane protein SirB2 [Phenylobacterium sp.]|jgi:uncharacterized membrane protein SirB2
MKNDNANSAAGLGKGLANKLRQSKRDGQAVRHKFNRRNKTNVKVRWLFWLSALAWLVFIIALVVYHYGRPEMDYGVFRYHGIAVRDHWLEESRLWYEGLLMVCVFLNLISLAINKKVMRRHQDRLRYNVVSLLLICIAILVQLLA